MLMCNVYKQQMNPTSIIRIMGLIFIDGSRMYFTGVSVVTIASIYILTLNFQTKHDSSRFVFLKTLNYVPYFHKETVFSSPISQQFLHSRRE